MQKLMDMLPDRIDAIVVGTGAAGLSAALALAPKKVLVITKTEEFASGSTPWAQGGIAAAISDEDSPEAHQQDTITAGAGLVDEDRALLLTEAGKAVMKRLIDEGFPADRKDNGDISLGREGAHLLHRVIHAGGDATGKALYDFLITATLHAKHITCLPSVMAVDLLTDQERVTGLQVLYGTELIDLPCPHVVLACGGIGGCFSFSTNPAESTGDGIAMAARAGAVIADPEFVQFHPTALAAGKGEGRRGLLTEALRGAGAHLLDGNSQRFMQQEHDLAELAPRDVVARAIFRRLQDGDIVRLDIRHVLAEKGEDAFPTVVTLCREAGIDPAQAPVPVAPAAHYHMGGVETDKNGASSIPGLWACGETASTGVHGANRLASNSLLEALVFGEKVAESITALPVSNQPGTITVQAAPQALSNTKATAREVRNIIYAAAGLIRHKDGMLQGLQRLTDIERSLVPAINNRSYRAWRRGQEIRNMLTTGRLVICAALQRKESRGGHARSDWPETSENCRLHSRLTLAGISGNTAMRRSRAAE